MNMTNCHECIQKITFESDKDLTLDLTLSLDSNVLHWNSDCYYKRDREFNDSNIYGLSVKTLTTKQSLVSVMKVDKEATSFNLIDKEIEVKNLTKKEN